jgi:hypothetical protein
MERVNFRAIFGAFITLVLNGLEPAPMISILKNHKKISLNLISQAISDSMSLWLTAIAFILANASLTEMSAM